MGLCHDAALGEYPPTGVGRIPREGESDQGLMSHLFEGMQFPDALQALVGSGSLGVTFPDGSPGMVIVLGFYGPTCGARALYEQGDGGVFLVDLTSDQPVSWDKVEPVALRIGAEHGKYGSIVKTTGHSHMGTGLNTSGHFQLLAITDHGFHLLFEGIEDDYGAAGTDYERELSYRFEGRDGDGTDEIVAEGRNCIRNGDPRELIVETCDDARYVYALKDGMYQPVREEK